MVAQGQEEEDAFQEEAEDLGESAACGAGAPGRNV